MRLSEAAAVAHGALRGRDALFEGVAIDSREIRRGDLFVAIRGAQHDGHEFVARAGEQGAVGALVSERNAGRDSIAEIGVRDTTEAIGRLGAHWRSRFALPVVAVTGSNGKTTVTALIAAIFNRAGNCLSPRASFNNHWGVPLTLLRLRESHTHAVIEMGMNHRGEIAYLSGLTKPTIALINNVAPAHLAGLADLQGIADAKAEIFGGLAPEGVAVLNADDSFHDHWRRGLQRLGVERVVRFGVRPETQGARPDIDVRATSLPNGKLELNIAGEREVVALALAGQHNIANAAAAAAVAHAAGVGIKQIREGLNAFPGALPGRLATFRGRGGALVIDDSYNANPVSVQAALDVLAERDGARIAVLGAMAELGAQSAELHEQVGKHARRSGVRHLLCVGAADDDNITGYLRGFGEEGERYDNLKNLLARLVPLLENPAPNANAADANNETTVLIKGSRAAAMERVVVRLRASDIPPDGDPPC